MASREHTHAVVLFKLVCFQSHIRHDYNPKTRSFVQVEHMSGEIQANASQDQLDSCVCLWWEQLHNQFEGACPSIYVIFLSDFVI